MTESTEAALIGLLNQHTSLGNGKAREMQDLWPRRFGHRLLALAAVANNLLRCC